MVSMYRDDNLSGCCWPGCWERRRVLSPAVPSTHPRTHWLLLINYTILVYGVNSTRRMNRIGKLDARSSALFVCDIQTRFQPLIYQMPSVIHCAHTMIHVANMLELPMVATEQYSKAFGALVPHFNAFLDKTHADIDYATPTEEDTELIQKLATPKQTAEDIPRMPVFPKTQFSMLTQDVQESIQAQQSKRTDVQGPVKSVILLGIEAHVCVQQTALDLLENGYEVHIVADATSSQRPKDRTYGLKRAAASGAFLTTSESIMFSLARDALHPKFKDISGLLKEHNKFPNELH
eukprot:gb/GECG01005717.1/.p1 GENE.gb/GECG01005717.1/~~gb/GECG01005717.1/.p1  ORF type:complete len:292 (+),score=21.19 gb/GECG01005717.1/:1-876(+)